MDTLPPALDALVWQAGRRDRARAVFPTGHAALDARLADGGWPAAALSELLLPLPGTAEVSLLRPAIAARAAAGDWLVLVSPPFRPSPGAWQAAGIDPRRLLLLAPPDARSWLWSAEQAARTPGCAVLAWAGRHALAARDLRRLQLAAQAGGNLVALVRGDGARTQASPAALRLALAARPRGQWQVEVLKQRGGFGGLALQLPLHEAHAATRLPSWQLPVHTSAPVPETREVPRAAVARPAFSRAADRSLDAGDG